jgi:hypothetical protein
MSPAPLPPESVRGWAIEYTENGRTELHAHRLVIVIKPDALLSSNERAVRVRVLREADYRRLLRAAAGVETPVVGAPKRVCYCYGHALARSKRAAAKRAKGKP